MTEIPEHLRKRAEEAKAKAAAAKGEAARGRRRGGRRGRGRRAERSREQDPRAPPRAVEGGQGRGRRHRGRRGRRSCGRRRGHRHRAPTNAPPVGVGPGGHTQRLLTVVKSGSIQDVKATPRDKVHVWPHLLLVEFVAALACTAFLLVFSIFVNAPLLELANSNQTPNPSKAPWYFLGLQELLKWFHPMVAGVLLPGHGASSA